VRFTSDRRRAGTFTARAGAAFLWLAGSALRPAPLPAAPPATPVDVIYDTDMALDVDDVGALALLHALADRGEARLLAVGISETSRHDNGVWAAPAADAINTYFGRPDIPIGVFRGPHQKTSDTGRYAEKTARAFPHDLASGRDAPEAYTLYRQVLAARADRSVTMLSVGFLTNLDALLRSGPDAASPLDGVELVRRKVKEWAIMGGRFPESDGDGEFNLATYPEATAYVLAHWPTPAVFSGFEIGVRVMTGARLIREHPPASSPVSRAYLEYTGGKDRESWDQTAALYAVRGLDHAGEVYFTAVGRGHNRFELTSTPRGRDGRPSPSRNRWLPEPDADQAYLVAAMAPERLARVIEDLMMHRPRTAAPTPSSR
jgi:inosine-uridine nucleoside N-ribohydrolase